MEKIQIPELNSRMQQFESFTVFKRHLFGFCLFPERIQDNLKQTTFIMWFLKWEMRAKDRRRPQSALTWLQRWSKRVPASPRPSVKGHAVKGGRGKDLNGAEGLVGARISISGGS